MVRLAYAPTRIDKRVYAILLNADGHLILKAQPREDRPPYYAPVGGMVTDDTTPLEDLLYDLVRTAIDAKPTVEQLVFFNEHQIEEDVIVRQYYFVAHVDAAPQDDDLMTVPMTPDAMEPLAIVSRDFKAFLLRYGTDVASLPDIR